MSLTMDILSLDEPYLEFGPGGEDTDPKTGLHNHGPLSLRFGPAHRERVRVGLVGPQAALDLARRWFARCQHYIPSESTNKALHPDFPGFQEVFRSSLEFSNLWEWEIWNENLEVALSHPPQERFNAVLDLYTKGIRTLNGRSLKPDVIVVCLSNEVIARCRKVAAPRLTRAEKKILKQQQQGQLALPGMDELVAIEDSLLYRDFRRALKARAMDVGIPIQIGTDNLFVDSDANEDPAARAWNVSLALFYKAGGFPWRLKSLAPETCYVGISFHHLRTRHRHMVFSSLAQAFPVTGEGFALRGDCIPWARSAEDRTLYLSEEQAASLAERVLNQYRQQIGVYPLRVVLYKTTQFNMAEQVGFKAAMSRIPLVEMVNLRPSEFRLVRRGAYPPRRGTVVNVNDYTHYLFTNGYFSPWNTYMGAHVPVPYEVTVLGDADPIQTCADVLGLTKLNWNSARAFTSSPIPLRFAREVGSIMSHYAELKGEGTEPDPSYRFYM